MKLKTILSRLSSRITDLTPTRDRHIKYFHDKEFSSMDNPKDRSFIISLSNAEFDSSPQVYYAFVEVRVMYGNRTNVWDAILDAAEDLEELLGHLSYQPGQEWVDDIDVAVMIESSGFEIDQESNYPTVIINLKFIW